MINKSVHFVIEMVKRERGETLYIWIDDGIVIIKSRILGWWS